MGKQRKAKTKEANCIKSLTEVRAVKYKCMSCGKIYDNKYLPTCKEGDGCCTIGSLIEMEE
jgi:hypothetical protein